MAEEMSEKEITVIYALADEQYVVSVDYTPGMTAAEAVARSGLAVRFPEIAAKPMVLGSFGQMVRPEQPLPPGARVEICRPLQRDPRELRRFMSSHGLVVGQRESEQD